MQPDQHDLKWHDSREFIEQRIILGELLAMLTPRQRRAVVLWSLGLTQDEIGEIMGIGQRSACYLITTAIKNLSSFSKYF